MEAKKTREPTPFERMTDFTRKIVHVPKDEIPDHEPRKRAVRKRK